MIWIKTDAGRTEIQARAVVKERALRNLLLLVDGKTSDDRLMAAVAGIQPQHFQSLQALGLIAPAPAPAPAKPAAPSPAVRTPAQAQARPPAAPEAAVDIDVGGLDFNQLRSVIGKLISTHLGLRGITLSMVLEDAMTVQDLRGVAQRVVKQIEQRKGAEAANAARRALSGL